MIAAIILLCVAVMILGAVVCSPPSPPNSSRLGWIVLGFSVFALLVALNEALHVFR